MTIRTAVPVLWAVACLAHAERFEYRTSDHSILRERLSQIASGDAERAAAIASVGAHHDHARKGQGAVDNWGGASLLSALLESLKSQPRRYTYVLASVAAVEAGLVGARAFVKALGKDRLASVQAMINVDAIGMTPTKIWVSRSD